MKKIIVWAAAGVVCLASFGYGQGSIFTVDSIGDVGKYISLCKHRTGVFHPYFSDSGFATSYYDATNGNLKFINDLGIDCGWADSPPIIIDSVGDVGQHTSIAAWPDSSGDSSKESILISYYDVTNGNLKCAWRRKYLSDTFKLFTIDSAGDVGLFTSLYVDTFNKVPYISYYDATNGDLKLAYFKDSAWVIQRVDSIGDVGRHSSIDGFMDTVFISYYDSTNGDLKLAKLEGMNWKIEKIDTTGDVGEYSAMEVGSFNYICLYISYYDLTNGDLREVYKYKDSLNWKFSTVDTTGDVGVFVNNASGSGYGLLYYYDKTNGDLRARGWFDPIDSFGDVGGYPAGAHFMGTLVMYYDFTNGNLKKYSYFEIGVEENAKVKIENSKLEIVGKKIYLEMAEAREVELKVYDLCGREKETIYSGTLTKGNYTFSPRVKNSGIYFIKLDAGKYKETKKMVMMR